MNQDTHDEETKNNKAEHLTTKLDLLDGYFSKSFLMPYRVKKYRNNFEINSSNL